MNKKIFIGLLLAVGILVACHDDTGFGPGRQPGYLYFLPTEGHSWTDGNNATRGVEAPMLMECSLDGQPIYLHTEVNPTMSPQLEESLNTMDMSAEDSTATAETRGVRYTDDVFSLSSGSTKISNFGVYATRQSDRGVIFNYKQIGPDDTDDQSLPHYPYDWNVKEEEIESVWDSGKADFYGYAPYFANPSIANGLSLAANASGVPTLTYTVPTTVADQLDILTAVKTGVDKGNDVELEFTHIMSAIKFNFAYGHEAYTGASPDGSVKGAAKSTFTWNDGLNDYNVTVSKIDIKNVYKKGSYSLADDPYDSGATRWTLDTEAGTENFSYSPSKSMTGESSSPVEINPDAAGNVFMMVPQAFASESTAQIQLTCDLVNTADATDTKQFILTVGLKDKEWKAGYTYTYTISLSDFVYVFDYNTATSKTYSNVVYGGTSEEDIFIRSYKVDSRGVKTNVDWELQYLETDADATGVGGSHGGDVPTWKTGSNGWIHVYDHSTGSYNTEVLDTHGGAHEGESDNIRLFKIVVGSIMTPIIDLSLWNQDQTKRWRGRSTSNCYIVAGPGTYRIPLIYGNAWTNGAKNERAYDSGKTASDNVLGKFLNYTGNTINTPFIKDNVGRSTVANACLVWEEGDGTSATNKGGNGSNEGTVIKVNPTIDTAITGEDEYNTTDATAGTQANCDYLQFEVKPETFNYGNAVVGIRDGSGNIIWSWHIWMIDAESFIGNDPTLNIEGNDITYATTNIGWVDGGRSIPALTRTGNARLVQAESGKIITIDATQQKRRAFTTYFTNVLYQWGRKDPLRGITNTNQEYNNSSNYTDGAPRGVAGVQEWYNIFETHPTVGGKISVADAIKKPNEIYGVPRGDMFETVYYNLWASTLSKVYNTNGGTWIFYGKTIYDPSPVGYCVPPSKCLTKLSRGGFVEQNTGATMPITCNYTGTNSAGASVTVPFHASGCRSTTAGVDLRARGFHTIAVGATAALGFYHTATPYSNDENWQLHLYFYPTIDTHNFIRGDMSEALSIKPVLWDGEIVEEQEVDQYQEYLTFTFMDSGSLYWQDSHSGTTSRTISYSTDKGETWTPVTSSFSGSGTKIADVAAKTVVWVKGSNNSYCSVDGLGVYHYQHFHSTAHYSLSGNIMSLIYGDNFKNQTSFPDGSSFNLCSTFYDPEASGNKNEQLEDVDNLVLPATSLTESCYESLFQNCTLISSSPELPATTCGTNCYKNMFNGCTNLNTVNVMLNPEGGTTYTNNWLQGVSSGGTFFYKSGASWTTNSTSGIPTGWSSVPLD